MRSSLAVLAVLSLVLLLGGCTLVDVQWAPHGHNHAFVSGYVDAGWPASNSLLKVGLFDGPSRGALLYLQIWKLLRVEVGFLGAALGVGPLDAGVGVFFYDPRPPAYIECEEDCDEACCEGTAERHEDEAWEIEQEEDEDAEAEADDVPFVYDAY